MAQERPMQNETTLEPGWLERTIQRAKVEVAAMPKWKRDWYDAWLAELKRPDPCHRRRACNEAQTCVGGCVYGNRH